MNADNLQLLREASQARSLEYPGDGKIDLSFRAMEFAGEAGELCNAVKKLVKEQRGIGTAKGDWQNIAEEIGDVMITLDLLANQLGLEIWPATVAKFNATTDKMGLKTRLEE
jgi:NTP pyrophosphatase (non-canonical NTP hydrolase)